MKRIAVLTSGGDAPGMNAAVRAVVRAAADKRWTALGVRDGFAGLMAGSLVPLGARDVGGIIQLGGTFLGSARSPEFKEETGQRRALDALAHHKVDALVVIGGNGSQAGAHALERRGFPVVGIASTIDNDLHGADITIGVDTALNVALEAIDRLRVTAASHRRVFLVEVMGRDSGYLAVVAGIAGGAEVVVVPEVEVGPDDVVAEIRGMRERGKNHALVVVAEGARHGIAALTQHLARADLGCDVRATTLGHVQRGGTPGAFDRLLGSRLGAAAVEQLATGTAGVLLGLVRGAIVPTSLYEVVATPRRLDPALLDLARMLAR
ncbi:MAG TPA: ATP-dependent 6-phosphofructokinase [Thermoanaerobaculia bacterium]|nr:ATP-dependent 6-phosphofructokinase [Thermoanaerobaculia bacterium]